MQRFDHLVDRLLAEVGNRVELRLRLRDQIADGLYARALEAVVGADSKLELLDQDAPLLSLQRRRSAGTHRQAVAVEGPARRRARNPFVSTRHRVKLHPIVVVLLDGVADRAHESLGGRTGVEAAHTPNLDRLCALGSCGVIYAIGPGRAPSSEVAHWSLLGYRPDEFPGRAVLEHAIRRAGTVRTE